MIGNLVGIPWKATEFLPFAWVVDNPTSKRQLNSTNLSIFVSSDLAGRRPVWARVLVSRLSFSLTRICCSGPRACPMFLYFVCRKNYAELPGLGTSSSHLPLDARSHPRFSSLIPSELPQCYGCSFNDVFLCSLRFPFFPQHCRGRHRRLPSPCPPA